MMGQTRMISIHVLARQHADVRNLPAAQPVADLRHLRFHDRPFFFQETKDFTTKPTKNTKKREGINAYIFFLRALRVLRGEEITLLSRQRRCLAVADTDSVEQQADDVRDALLDRLRRGEVEAERLAERVLVREIEKAQRHATDQQLLLIHVRADFRRRPTETP